MMKEFKIVKDRLQDFLENPMQFGLIVTKNDKVLFAKNYKSYNKVKEAFDLARDMQKVYNYKPDDELTFHIWNGGWFIENFCLLTEETTKKCDELSKKWYDFLFKETPFEDRGKIKEVHFNQKNYDLISRKGHINYLNSYPVIVDDNVKGDFEVVYKTEDELQAETF